MEIKFKFEKQYRKLFWESVIRSVVFGLVFGFGLAFVCAMAFWIAGLNLWWTAFIAFAVGTAAASVILYFAKYRPTVVSGARRMDRLGLEERLVTMVELQGEDSYIAKRQREDAMEKLHMLSPSSIKIKVSLGVIIAALVSFTLAAVMTTLSALSAAGFFPSWEDIIDEVVPEEREVYYAVTYDVTEGGYIEGEADQLVLAGKDAERVQAVADEGYMFGGWDDGYEKPVRQDKGITKTEIFTAIFLPIEDEGMGAGMPGDDGPPQDGPGDSPGDGENTGETEDANGTTGGGKYEEANQVIDGKVYYREILGMYRDDIIAYLEEYGDSLSAEERAIIEYYITIV
jgi:hypothetical protein